MDDQSLIGDGKTVIEMISDQVPKLIGDQFDRPSNVHGKTGPKYWTKFCRGNDGTNNANTNTN